MVNVVLIAGMLLLSLVLPDRSPASTDVADRVILIKNRRVLLLIENGEILRAYKVALGKQPLGPKIKEGDKRTPEGTYILDSRKPQSKFYRGLHVSYPSEADSANARKLGVLPGGDIMLHGLSALREPLGKFHRRYDWTDGCIAVTNTEIEEIWKLVPDGTPIEIRP
jgi:murein L,D-transpeptidase YafK